MNKIIFSALSSLLPILGLAETPVNSLTATFFAGDDGLVANDIAESDGVTYSTSGTWELSAIGLSPSQEITICAEEFKNICSVNIIVENEWSSYLSQNKAALSIVSAKGEGIESLQDLGCNLTSSFEKYDNKDYDNISGICRFDFGQSIRLSEVSFKPNIYVGVMKINVILDVTPLVPAESVNIYTDEVVPFQKQSNYLTYRYHISEDTENIIEDAEELDGKFEPVPEEGITLSGRPDGDYIVYVIGPATFPPALCHMKVRYETNPAVSIIETSKSAESACYDLLGRRISRSQRGLQIMRRGNKSSLVVQ